MKRNISIKIKALFLLLVFALNTVVGFACAIGVDMGFNSKHHHHDERTEALVRAHANQNKHFHHEKKESLNRSASHHHDELNSQQNSGDDKDGCCNGKVISFEQLDKSIPNSLSLVHPVFATSFLAAYYYLNILPYTDVVRDKMQFVRSYHPPISDIRIAIQSFQI